MSEEKINGHYTNVPPHLGEFLKVPKNLEKFHAGLKDIPYQDLYDFAVECVVVNNKHYNHIFKNSCCICDKELTEDELKLIESNDHIVVCGEHRSSACCFQIDVERAKFGISPRKFI